MIQQESLVSLAAREIRKLIVSGELAPGGKLNEPPLAEKLGISRPPLREALRTLESEGLLEQSPRRGYRVVSMTDTDIDEIYSLRRALEMFALDRLLARKDPGAYSSLDPIMKAMRAAARRGDRPAVVQANIDFHTALVDAAGHRRLSDTYRSLMVQMQVSMAANVLNEERSKGDLTKGCDRHAELLECLRSGDADRIRREFEEHGERDYLARQGTVTKKAAGE
ncbi:transcriptional regulator, GntR family [Pseudarthrobacter chlorophenolicus A6]|uniref:Transcriptional regulator, GntR family n=1 Tax=Pseudarthrobacter chlorophenolicus (strain ATCC 700700 / DSM 12829 / CIP 107037 / JCM 12360 / KCTC 9906 / NCIMB 13794 / A6) TaxID=452863 RepID=B8HE80_PSECP|nr:GntR family transcriptional regulator [Pseudarthrobacter chlorophenolicus]ACL39115.1 transcriptional regulator, GntR family [Pseudarthrobacter chlorophenolicus A6]SDR04209.1 DNA-binding transcriptional regulator, GntR family [Pseudarthrobacter chlorophenolicus]